MSDWKGLQAVIWDMDRVMVDSGPAYFESWKRTFVRYGIQVSPQRLRETFGMTSAQIIQGLVGG